MSLPRFLGPGTPIRLPSVAAMASATTGIKSLGFSIQGQKQTEWCWAAVSASVSAFYKPATTWTQCAVAGACLGKPCCDHPAGCNTSGYLDDALRKTTNLVSVQGVNLPFDAAAGVSVKSEIDAGRLIGCRIGWDPATDPDAGHFNVIHGYDTANQDVDVGDPYFGPNLPGSAYGPYLTLPYGQFVKGYQSIATATWTDSYLTKG